MFYEFKKISLIQRNRFVYIEENFFESTKLSSIQRNFFFDRISEKCFFDSKKLFSGCDNFVILCNSNLFKFLVFKRYYIAKCHFILSYFIIFK